MGELVAYGVIAGIVYFVYLIIVLITAAFRRRSKGTRVSSPQYEERK